MGIEAAPSVKFLIIREITRRDNNMLNIAWLCNIAGVSRSGYYSWLAAEPARVSREEQDRKDKVLLTDITYLLYGDGKKSYMSSIIDAYPVQMFGLPELPVQ